MWHGEATCDATSDAQRWPIPDGVTQIDSNAYDTSCCHFKCLNHIYNCECNVCNEMKHFSASRWQSLLPSPATHKGPKSGTSQTSFTSSVPCLAAPMRSRARLWASA